MWPQWPPLRDETEICTLIIVRALSGGVVDRINGVFAPAPAAARRQVCCSVMIVRGHAMARGPSKISNKSAGGGASYFDLSETKHRELKQAEQVKLREATYCDALMMIPLVHRRLLDVIKDEFHRRKIGDVNPEQALLMYTIGGGELSISELKARNFCIGSNIALIVKKLVVQGYIESSRRAADSRPVFFTLTDRGNEIHEIISSLFLMHSIVIGPIGAVSGEDLSDLKTLLVRLDRFWADQIKYRL